MTLILNVATPHYVLQVADRLVTRRAADGFRPFDPLSNKGIVYFAKDGVGAISYTGAAYVGTTPTDRWLTEKLIGKALKESAPRTPSMGVVAEGAYVGAVLGASKVAERHEVCSRARR